MLNEKVDKIQQGLLPVVSKLILGIIVLVIGLIAMPIVFYYKNQPDKPKDKTSLTDAASTEVKKETYWTAPAVSSITDAKQKEQVEYGKELIAHTAKYLGPNGSVLKIGNGLNCQNCHLQAGTAVFGNNYGSVASLYPKFRARSGGIENVYNRVNDCFQRSLNGKAIDTAGKEMQAIVAYINYLGTNVEKWKKAEGSGLKELLFLDRAADPQKGLIVTQQNVKAVTRQMAKGFLMTKKPNILILHYGVKIVLMMVQVCTG